MIKKAKEGLIGILQCIGLVLSIVFVLWLIYLFIITPWYVFWGGIAGILLLIFGVINLIRGSSPIAWLLPSAEKTPSGGDSSPSTPGVGEEIEKGKIKIDSHSKTVKYLKKLGYLPVNFDPNNLSDADWERLINAKPPQKNNDTDMRTQEA